MVDYCPPCLLEVSQTWPFTPVNQPTEITAQQSESRKATVLHMLINSSINDLLDCYSSLDKILHIIAYVLRFGKARATTLLSTAIGGDELAHALIALIYFTQRTTYSDNIEKLSKGVHPSKDLRSLDLFLDPSGIVRVGGRLTNANIPYVHKHPALLSSSHLLTKLIIDYHHIRLKHPGVHALQTHLQQEYWIQ